MSEETYSLLIDIGNSRIKWGRGKNGGIETGEPFSTHDSRALASFLGSQPREPRPQQIVVSNVAGSEIAAKLQERTWRRWGVSANFVHSQAQGFGVVNGYENPEKLGVDRWAALVGARRICQDAVCVADVGTAITWDVLDAEGRHLGGLIAPGLELMRRSLARGTCGLILANENVRDKPGTDTDSAIASGTLKAVIGLIEHAYRETTRRFGEEPRLLLTGGDEPAIAAGLEIPFESKPDLVLEGLYAMAVCAP